MTKTINIEEVNTDEIQDVRIDRIFPNVIDDVLVTIVDGHHTLFLPINFNGIQFRNWKKGRGGMFSKDVLNYSLNKSCAKYILLHTANLTCIARLIDEDEEELFRSLKLIEGQIKDKFYMILKNIENKSKLTSTFININEREPLIQLDTISFYPNNTPKAPDEDFDHHTGSISLFTE
jgi:hypothetical protein